MQSVPNLQSAPPPSLAGEELRRLLQRSDRKGLVRFAGHLLAIAASGWLYHFAIVREASAVLVVLAAMGYGFTFVTMFAAMHEAVHRTAFASGWLNSGVGWLAGLLSFYNSTFFRHYHTWHHRFANLPGQDPELDDRQPTHLVSYLIGISGFDWWVGKLRTYGKVALGKTAGYVFLNDKTAPAVVRSVRWQIALYGLAIGVSCALGRPYFLWYWLLPVAAAQPLLRAILLAEHTGCSQDKNPLTNTRTTLTVLPVRFLMWEMPFHAEHHRYPALPFFALAAAHQTLGPQLRSVARAGYLGVHVALVRSLSAKPPARLSA